MRHDYPHAETQRAQRSHGEFYYFTQNKSFNLTQISQISQKLYTMVTGAKVHALVVINSPPIVGEGLSETRVGSVLLSPRPPCQGPRPLEGWGAERAT